MNHSIKGQLEKQHYRFYTLTFLLGILFILGIQMISLMGRNQRDVSVYSADKLIQQNSDQIDLVPINEKQGSVQIIDQELEVTTLTKEGYIKEKRLTPEELGKYFAEFGKTEVSATKYNVSFAYERQQKYWMVVAFPVPLEIQVSMMGNLESTEFVKEMIRDILILGGYIAAVIFSIIKLSNKASAYFIEPLKELEIYTEQLKEGIYENTMGERLKGEFGVLQDSFYDLARRLQEKTEENRQMAVAKNEMILDISHDLKNPLASIQGYSELLGQERELEMEKVKRYSGAIYQNSIRANRILMSLFEFAQLESQFFKLQIKRVDFCEFIRLRVLEEIDEFEIKGIEMECAIPEKEYWVEIDETQMQRVWANLVGNAVKYLPRGSMIKIEVRRGKKEIVLEIADNGEGMTEEEAKHIFEPFIRRDKARNSKTGGSGLGLAIVKKIIEAHGGKIFLEAKQGQGCSFIIKLKEI